MNTKEKAQEKLFRNISIFSLIASSILFGVVANIIAKYDGSYFRVMFGGSLSSLLITSVPIIVIISSVIYLFYSVNKK